MYKWMCGPELNQVVGLLGLTWGAERCLPLGQGTSRTCHPLGEVTVDLVLALKAQGGLDWWAEKQFMHTKETSRQQRVEITLTLRAGTPDVPWKDLRKKQVQKENQGRWSATSPTRKRSRNTMGERLAQNPVHLLLGKVVIKCRQAPKQTHRKESREAEEAQGWKQGVPKLSAGWSQPFFDEFCGTTLSNQNDADAGERHLTPLAL